MAGILMGMTDWCRVGRLLRDVSGASIMRIWYISSGCLARGGMAGPKSATALYSFYYWRKEAMDAEDIRENLRDVEALIGTLEGLAMDKVS